MLYSRVMVNSKDVTSRRGDRPQTPWRTVALPLGPVVCSAIYPTPTNCDPTYRVGTTAVLTGIILVMYFVTVILGFTVRSRFPGLVRAGVIALVVLLIVSYFIVAWSPGFVISWP